MCPFYVLRLISKQLLEPLRDLIAIFEHTPVSHVLQFDILHRLALAVRVIQILLRSGTDQMIVLPLNHHHFELPLLDFLKQRRSVEWRMKYRKPLEENLSICSVGAHGVYKVHCEGPMFLGVG